METVHGAQCLRGKTPANSFFRAPIIRGRGIVESGGRNRNSADCAKALVAEIQTGNREAEAELVNRYGRTLSFLLRNRIRDPDAVQDVYQETFRLALEKIRNGEVRQPELLPRFLSGLARNLTYSHFRRRSRRGEEDLDSVAEPPDPTSDQLGRLVQQEKDALVQRLLKELSRRDRQALFRVYIAEDDRDDICSDLGLSPSQFNLVLFRARKRYRQLYEKYLQEHNLTSGAGG